MAGGEHVRQRPAARPDGEERQPEQMDHAQGYESPETIQGRTALTDEGTLKPSGFIVDVFANLADARQTVTR